MTRADYVAALIVGLLTVLLVGGLQYLITPQGALTTPGRVEAPIVAEPFP
jgi:hypothetical protein